MFFLGIDIAKRTIRRRARSAPMARCAIEKRAPIPRPAHRDSARVGRAPRTTGAVHVVPGSHGHVRRPRVAETLAMTPGYTRQRRQPGRDRSVRAESARRAPKPIAPMRGSSPSSVATQQPPAVDPAAARAARASKRWCAGSTRSRACGQQERNRLAAEPGERGRSAPRSSI